MKNWCKVLVLGLVCGIATTTLIACGPKLDATIRDDNQTIEQQTNDQTNQGEMQDSTTQQDVNQNNNPTQNDAEDENQNTAQNQNEENDDENPITPELCQHQFDDWHTEQEATCSTQGSEVSYCTLCGERTTRSIPTNNHHNETTEIFAPTCTQAGYTLHTCLDCGISYHSDEVSALGHKYNCEIIPATCNEVGYEIYTCERCSDEYYNELPISDHTFDTNTHRCTGCGLFQDPIENLDGSKWYIKIDNENDWSIGKKQLTLVLDGGNYKCYKQSTLLDDGTCIINQENLVNKFTGRYEISTSNGIHYLKLINNQSCNCGIMFELTYQVVQDDASGKVYYTFSKAGHIFDYEYQNSTLVFCGYGL